MVNEQHKQIETLQNDLGQVLTDIDATWVITAGILVFFMQAGFGMLEAGTVAEKNVVNIMYKNLMDATIAAIVFAAFGYGFAYGGAEPDGPFIGTGNFGLSEEFSGSGFHSFFFQWTFSAAAATIVSGSVAERCKLSAYFIYSFFLTGFTYPIVVHWVWDSEGWLSAFNEIPFMGDYRNGPGGTNSMLDFAGCSVVHMVGGFAGLVAAILIGPRQGRFEGREYRPHNMMHVALGVLILWFGWYGFNAGSTLMISEGASGVAARCAATTTISASAGCLTCTVYGRVFQKKYDLVLALNGVLAGLVSITAGCAIISPWGAFGVGAIGACVFIGSSRLLMFLKIDDPLDACPIHGFCGIWGALAVGIFATDANVKVAYGFDNDCIATWLQLRIQIVGVLAIITWTLGSSAILFLAIKYTVGLRVDEATEADGLDSKHGATAYVRQQSIDYSVQTSLISKPKSTQDEPPPTQIKKEEVQMV